MAQSMTAGLISRLNPIFTVPTMRHSASVIFLHGSGGNGPDLKLWMKMVLGQEFEFPHVKIIYPTAPERPYTASNGAMSTVWFDRKQISPSVEEDEEGTIQACNYVAALVENEVNCGIPKDRIVVGGFSMGGGLAFHYTYRHGHDLAGGFALSSFLPNKSAVYELLQSQPDVRRPPLLQCHGQRDDLVLYEWGQETHKRLKQLNVPVNFYSFANLFHELNRKEAKTLRDWITTVLPES